MEQRAGAATRRAELQVVLGRHPLAQPGVPQEDGRIGYLQTVPFAGVVSEMRYASTALSMHALLPP